MKQKQSRKQFKNLPPILFLMMILALFALAETGSAAVLPTVDTNQQTVGITSDSCQDSLKMVGSLPLRAAYIHNGDLVTAAAFRTLLAEQGISLSLVTAATVPTTSFTDCDVILIGADTGEWRDTAVQDHLLNTALPLMGLGEGGLRFLTAVNQVEELTSGTSQSATVTTGSRAAAAYRALPAADVAADASLDVYTTAATAHWVDIATPLPDGVEIGRLPQTSQYPLVQLADRFFLWGFQAGPDQMTDAGRALFIDTIALQTEALQVPLRSRQFVPPAGVEQALLDDLTAAPAFLHAFVQLKPAPACQDADALAKWGIGLHAYFWGQTYIATISPDLAPAEVLNSGCVRWIGRLQPQDKIMTTLLDSPLAPWVDNGDGTVNLLVTFFSDTSEADAAAVLADSVTAYTPYATHMWAVTMPAADITRLAQQDQVRWIQGSTPPPLPLLDDARALMNVNSVQNAEIQGANITYHGLDGSGITAGVWDTGFDDAHPDFADRILVSSGVVDDHGTHVAGILGGSGVNSQSEGGNPYQWRGMAPNVDLAFYTDGFSLDNIEEALDTYGMNVSNHSYLYDCMSVYDAAAQVADDIVRGAYEYNGDLLRAHQIIWAAGNEGESGQYCDPDENGYHSLGTVAGKNILVAGALVSSDVYWLSGSSSRGPTYDGRVKPDVMAIGRMKAPIPGGGYTWKGGTSMAAPTVTGITSLVLEQYGLTYGTTQPAPAAIRGLLINNATDLTHTPGDPGYQPFPWNDPDIGEPIVYHQGPDFATGYGVVHGQRTVNAVQHKAVIDGVISDVNDVDEYTIEVPSGREELRFTLVWDDVPADPALADDAIHLVNNLELVLIDDGGNEHYPWVLDPLPPDAPFTINDIDPAYRAQDNRNNVEQVTVWAVDVNPSDWSGTWTVQVSADSLPEGPQSYSLVGEWREIDLQNVYPMDAGYNQAPDLVVIPVYVRNEHLDAVSAAGGTTIEDWQVRIGDNGSNTWTDATIEATYGPVGDLAYLVVRPPDSLAANTMYDLQIILTDLYQVDQHTTEDAHIIDTDVQLDAISFGDQPRPPADEMIVVDNSGSMADYGKLESAQNAARAFADRREAGDMIGLANFDDNASTLYPLTLVSPGEGELNDVKSDINGMGANGATALGSGLLEAKDELDNNGDGGHDWHIVLLSDGMENVAPCWDTGPGNPHCDGETSVQPDFMADGCPTITIDTVTIGPENASWLNLLEDIADETCGQAWNAVVDEMGGFAPGLGMAPGFFPQTLPNNLADIYITIADGNTHQQRLWEKVGTFEQTGTVLHDIELEGGLPEATFAINWALPQFPLQIQLIRPSGVAVSAADADAHVKFDATHQIFRMETPQAGTWRLMLMGTASPSLAQEYLATVSANTDVTMLMTLGLPPQERVVGAEMPIYVVLADEVDVLTEAAVELHIQHGGIEDVVSMFDDGTNGDQTPDDGVYTTLYSIPSSGSYQVKAVASGVAHDGEAFTRYLMRHFQVARPARVAYLYDTDLNTATDYANLLDANGMSVDRIHMNNIFGTDFRTYDLIIVGPDTGYEDTWGTAIQVAKINRSLKPVLGLGDGGHAFFGQLSLGIGYNNGVAMSSPHVMPHNLQHIIWNAPYDVNSVNNVVPVYAGRGSSGRAVYGSDGEWLASQPPNSLPLWIVREADRYLLWGFNAGPKSMVETGQELFVNTAWYAQE